MRRYETILILRPNLSEDEINTIIDNTTGIITGDKGKIIDLDRWGMRKLAYPIKKEVQGFYVLCDFTGTPQAVSEVERRFRIDDAVLRYLTVKTADEISDEEVAAAVDQAANKKVAGESEEETEADTAAETETESASEEE